MSQYPLTKLYLPELKVFGTDTKDRPFYSASDLEAALATGVVMYGEDYVNKEFEVGNLKYPFDDRIGLLIGYQPIPQEKPVTKEELIKVIQELDRVRNRNIVAHDNTADDLIERIKKTEVIK